MPTAAVRRTQLVARYAQQLNNANRSNKTTNHGTDLPSSAAQGLGGRVPNACVEHLSSSSGLTDCTHGRAAVHALQHGPSQELVPDERYRSAFRSEHGSLSGVVRSSGKTPKGILLPSDAEPATTAPYQPSPTQSITPSALSLGLPLRQPSNSFCFLLTVSQDGNHHTDYGPSELLEGAASCSL
ncbi:hypothetical protein BASA62_004612 [Batrachochytrium salamandrivorans]|nr:hypothetical protein BASA62_004612 [Batrachochytrium salamandrivorans]